MTSAAVRVGLRVRPLTEKELINNCTECLTIIPNEPQILIGTDKSFTYDYVFGSDTDQAQVYLSAASPLLHKFTDGFNATILAYGQTGSGKTFSMGTNLDNKTNTRNEGIIPRCIVELFRILKSREAEDKDYKFEIYVSFLELYNEEFIDLLNQSQTSKRRSASFNQQNYNVNTNSEVSIREDIAGNIYWSGVKEEICYSPEELLGYLAQGSLSRTTGSTEMNSVSSRSHAIFSVILKQQKPENDDTGKKVTKLLTSKFHFVDLAGSERLKRTHAQGDRAREGIAINSGLLALGNVISALGDETRKATHIPYRDSKLTRLLQDSLGGNSQTLMLACVSPADTNFMETLNTLKYANRARNIKNRVAINQDFKGSSVEVNQLKSLVSHLRMEITMLRSEGPSSSNANASSTFHKSSYHDEVNILKASLQEMSNQIIRLTSERDTLLIEREFGEFMQNENTDDSLLENIGTTRQIQIHPTIEKYQNTIQELTNKLEDTKDQLQKSNKMQNLLKQQQEQHNVYNNIVQKFSANQPKVKNNSSSNRRRKYNGQLNTNTSFTTRINARRPILTKSNSTGSRSTNRQKRHIRIKSSKHQKDILQTQKHKDFQNEEYAISELKEDEIRHEEVKESIAKVRADIRKSMEVLELVKPLNNVTNFWEKELEAFEAEDKRIQNFNDMQRVSSDEGIYSLSPSPVEDDYIHDIETLPVPTWKNNGQTSHETTKDEKSTLESDWKIISSINHTSTANEQNKYNSQLCRMFHQIQSDIKVKEELVSHLEKSENEFTYMREKFDEKINMLQLQLAETQKEKDIALMKVKSGLAIKSDIAQHQMQQNIFRSFNTTTAEKHSIEIRQTYELKIKALTTEIHDLKRKYSHVTMTMQQARSQNETLLRSLRSNMEILKTEKKRLAHRMKIEAERVREQLSKQDRKVQQLQRQHAKSNQIKRQIEREYEQQKSTLKRCNEELVINANQVKQLTAIMKKAIREGGVLDEKMLNNVSPIMGGSFAVIVRGGGHGFPRRLKKKNPIPLGIRVSRKKELLDKALHQYIQGKQAVVEMEQLLVRREKLTEESLELKEERHHVYNSELEHHRITGKPINVNALEAIDERIDVISAEISYLSARIRTLQSEAAEEALRLEESDNHTTRNALSKPSKHVIFVDEILSEPSHNEEWTDIDTFDEQFSVPVNASPELAYDITSKLIKSFDFDECKPIIENLLDDIMDMKMNECSRQDTVQNLEKTVIDLRRALVVMKQPAASGITRNEQNLHYLNENNTADIMIQEIVDSNSILPTHDREYEYTNFGVYGLEHGTQSSHLNLTLNDMCKSSENCPKRHQDTKLPNSPLDSSSNITHPYSVVVNDIKNNDVKNCKPTRMLESNYKNVIPLRECTPSPDRFYNMVQKRLSWQQQMVKDQEMLEDSSIDSIPANFEHYVADHDSSTSSIRSDHLRRNSIQSDASIPSTWKHKTKDIQHNVIYMDKQVKHTDQPEMSIISPLLERIQPNSSLGFAPRGEMNVCDSHYTKHHQNMPAFTNSCQQAGLIRWPLSPLMTSASTFEKTGTLSVFDRLAQTPTRAFSAKINYRHSSSSVDELRKRWEHEQGPSTVNDNWYS
ncbi:MAG: hypothetical protein EXX96DRAFT_544885 [Benjaminiella poitrasii]|nr:MAG: hypothetical protein EXX96DRAFT_544885 [Benjaminiella poitrasii]